MQPTARPIIKSLKERLKQGDKVLVGNKGYRKYLKREGEQAVFSIDEDNLAEKARYDGLWALRTNTNLSIGEVAFQYNQLWMVEQALRALESVLKTHSVYHKCDDTIRGHVFCKFLALLPMKELLSRLEVHGKTYEWEDTKRHLAALRELELRIRGHAGSYFLRSEVRACRFDVLKAAARRRAPEPAALSNDGLLCWA
jgi:transposase